MEALTRSCFMFLASSRPLNLATWPGYAPKRGQLDNTFPAERLVVYTLRLALPQAVSELGTSSSSSSGGSRGQGVVRAAGEAR
jgi:hypothetical protein